VAGERVAWPLHWGIRRRIPSRVLPRRLSRGATGVKKAVPITKRPSVPLQTPPASQLLGQLHISYHNALRCCATATEAPSWKTTSQATAPGACACCGEGSGGLGSRTRHERRSQPRAAF
jgi:hypothetical protein